MCIGLANTKNCFFYVQIFKNVHFFFYQLGSCLGVLFLFPILIKITTYWLKQQIKQLEAVFLKEGGIGERMSRTRIEARNKKT